MALKSVKFVAGPDGVNPVSAELDDELIRFIARNRLEVQPAAYVVLNQDLPGLAKLDDLVIDRGRKHEAKPLAKLLLGHTKIPFVKGSYESSGQLVRSVRALLENAFAKDDHNIYIIGTSREVLEGLTRKASKGIETAGRSSRSRPDGSFSAKAVLERGASTEQLLQLLPRHEIPEELIRTYVGSSVEIQLVRQLVMRAAASEDPVLVLGDTGTGKEVIARSIHNYGARASEKFVAVNCGAIPTDLFESELFGHKKYTFTDAKHDKKGLWEITGNGTLFLDEIGDLTLNHQVKILRALDENRIRPIGGVNEVGVNARVIAATNRDLFSMVKAGQFREDLYYRLRSFLLRTPGLRDHPEDIPTLARFFWKKITRDERASLPEDIMAELQLCPWPGNARELKAVLMSLHSLFGQEDLDAARLRAVFQIQTQGAAADRLGVALGNEMIAHRVDCLRHFRSADEVLRACVVSARPLVGGSQAGPEIAAMVGASLKARLGELEVLCLNPLRFHSKVIFYVVDGLREKILHFCKMLEGEGQGASDYWKNEVSPDMQLALSAMFQESERLEANV